MNCLDNGYVGHQASVKRIHVIAETTQLASEFIKMGEAIIVSLCPCVIRVKLPPG